MEESKTLIEKLREMVEKSRKDGGFPTDFAEPFIGRRVERSEEERELFATIADRIEKEYMELPMLEGEPLKVGDKVDGYNQVAAKVEAIMNSEMIVVRSTVKGGSGYHDGAYPLLLWRVNELKRHVEEVLDADGVPIHVGDTVCSQDGKSFTIQEIMVDYGDDVRTVFCGEYHKGLKVWRIATDLTHNQPDTLERIEADARKMFNDYWGCRDAECRCCPVMVDGKRPRERYENSGSCATAQRLDLLRRQREVMERGQE